MWLALLFAFWVFRLCFISYLLPMEEILSVLYLSFFRQFRKDRGRGI